LTTLRTLQLLQVHSGDANAPSFSEKVEIDARPDPAVAKRRVSKTMQRSAGFDAALAAAGAPCATDALRFDGSGVESTGTPATDALDSTELDTLYTRTGSASPEAADETDLNERIRAALGVDAVDDGTFEDVAFEDGTLVSPGPAASGPRMRPGDMSSGGSAMYSEDDFDIEDESP